MKTQHKYKADAHEKKYGGEDYGTDEENINREEIERYMRMQREKEKERLRRKERVDGETRDKRGSMENRRDGRPTATQAGRLSSSRTSSMTPPTPPPPPPSSQPQRPGRPITSRTNSANSANSANSSARSNLSYTHSQMANPELPNHTIPSNKSSSLLSKQSALHAEVDLLGLSTSSEPAKSTASNLRDTLPLNQFHQTDYTTNKANATKAFKSGDYTTALELYNMCLLSLPAKHELRIVVLSNLALTNKLLGHLRTALESVEEALQLMNLEECNDNAVIVAEKPVKYWYVKLVSIQAETLELMEKYADSLERYVLLIQKLGCNDKKVMDGKRRVDRIINPENYKPVKKPAHQLSTGTSASASASASKNTSNKPGAMAATAEQREGSALPAASVQSASRNVEQELDPLVKDRLESKVQNWTKSKNNELRAMLTNLHEILPISLPNDKLRHLQLTDLVLPKQVKIQYMKVISSIHPDKLASRSLSMEDALVCSSVFITLNERWELFRKEESI